MPANHWLSLDGGGKWRDRKYVAFCGYVDSVERLELFKDSWRPILTEYGLEALHYTEAMAWHGDWAKWYAKWGEADRDAKRAEALMKFVKAIRAQPTLSAVGFGAPSTLIKEKATDAKRPELALFEKALTMVSSQLQGDDTLSILCDWEDGFDQLCLRLLTKLRLQNVASARNVSLIAFADDKKYAELQAADLLAYLSCQEMERRDERPKEVPNPLFAALTEKVSITTGVSGELFDAETFRRMVESQVSPLAQPTRGGVQRPLVRCPSCADGDVPPELPMAPSPPQQFTARMKRLSEAIAATDWKARAARSDR